MSRLKSFKQKHYSICLSLLFIIIISYSFSFQANALTVDSAVVKFDAKKGNKDSFYIKGHAEGIYLAEGDSVTLQFGNFSETIPFRKFNKIKNRFVYHGNKRKSGIKKLVINTKTKIFKADGIKLNLDELVNPVEVHLLAGAYEGCMFLEFREKKKQMEV